MDISISQKENIKLINRRFTVEFIGYNFLPGEVVKKIYLKHERRRAKDYKTDIYLKTSQIEGLALALSNKFISTFNSDRYSLYDVSFREMQSFETVGFSFIDTHDYEYIEPEMVFDSFIEFGIDEFLKDIFFIENGLFRNKPQYNPIFMFGTVFERSILKSLKAYIRYDLTEVPNIIDRLNKLNSIANIFDVRSSSTSDFYKAAEDLESMGFVFSFVGVDCYENNEKRYKIYFRNIEENNNVLINEGMLQLLNKQLRVDASKIFRTQNNGLWGVAIATKSFEYVNGIQVYFYP